jgi:hypothetical protein
MTDAIPWYRSRILQGLLTIIVTQIVAKVTAQYHINFEVLGLSVNDIVAWLMNLISAGAAAWAVHARVAPSVPIPAVVTLTQGGADKANLAPTPFPLSPKEIR